MKPLLWLLAAALVAVALFGPRVHAEAVVVPPAIVTGSQKV